MGKNGSDHLNPFRNGILEGRKNMEVGQDGSSTLYLLQCLTIFLLNTLEHLANVGSDTKTTYIP